MKEDSNARKGRAEKEPKKENNISLFRKLNKETLKTMAQLHLRDLHLQKFAPTKIILYNKIPDKNDFSFSRFLDCILLIKKWLVVV